MNTGEGDGKTYLKTFSVRLSDLEMAAIAACLAGYFNRLTANKQTIPVEYAELVVQAMQKMKAAAEGNPVLVVAK